MAQRRRVVHRTLIALALLTITSTAAAEPPEVAWTHQFGTSSVDSVNAVSAKGSDIYAVGETQGTLPEESSQGLRDAFIRRYDASGNIVWTDQFGTAMKDSALGVDASPAGIYVVGYADRDHLNQSAFVKGYDTAGNALWSDHFVRQHTSTATDVEVTSSGIFVVGQSLNGEYHSKGFVRRYDMGGKVIWTRVFGAGDYNEAGAVAAGSSVSGIYVTGRTSGAMVRGKRAGGSDVFVRRYNGSGKIIWTRQFGTRRSDGANSVAAVSSGIYVAGFTSGALRGQNASGHGDAFVRRYGPSGKAGWTRQFGTSGSDAVQQVAATSSEIYVAGNTGGELRGQVSSGGSDAFIRSWENSGTRIWTQQFGTSGFDFAWGADVASSGIYIGGVTDGTFPGQANSGIYDAFVARYVENQPTPRNLAPRSSSPRNR
jgi:hypothetical protein